MNVTAANDTSLVIPVDITALCVGTIDESDPEGTRRFAGATTVFTHQSGNIDAYVGSNVVRALTNRPWQQLTSGIHLHWGLPNALTKGTNDKDGNISFNAAPNRWLISRIIITGKSPSRRTWIIESDALDIEMPAGQAAITLPVKVVGNDPDYRYTGMYKDFTDTWTDPGNLSAFKDLTGQQLSAVSSGDATFAAFYPNSNSVFGFYDQLKDLEEITDPGTTVNIMYQLTGWFSDPQNDPLFNGKTKAEINELFQWTYEGASATTDHSLYSGLVQDINWNRQTKYVVDQPNQLPVDATITIGNTPAESFAACFRNRLHKEIPFFETLLNAFQNGLLEEFQQPTPDQLSQLEEQLQQKTFASFSEGIIYQIVQGEKDTPELVDIELPLLLAGALNKLNIYQQQGEYYDGYISSFQWQLFADWYKLVNATDINNKNILFHIIQNNLAIEWPKIKNKRKELDDLLVFQKQSVENLMAIFDTSLILKTAVPARYWQPNEPSVLLTSGNLKNIVRSRVQKENYDDNGYLLCRTGSQLITGISVNNTGIPAGQFAEAGLPSPNHLPYPDTCNLLLLESLLLNTQLIASNTGASATELKDALEKALKKITQSVYTFTGQLPSVIAVAWWNKNPWLPVFTEWSVQYYPLESTEADGKLKDYTTGLFLDNYSIDQDKGGALTYKGTIDPAAIDFSNAQKYTGSALISNSPAFTFRKQLNEYLVRHENETLKGIETALSQEAFLTAPLSGLNDLLRMQQQNMQLNINVTRNNPYLQITNLLKQVAGSANTVSPTPNGYFNPVRAGFLKFSLNIVDVYGQKRAVNIIDTITSEQLTTVYQNTTCPDIVYMPARLTQPSRLLFRWLAAAGDEIQEMNTHPATTPICGWFLPDHLDGSLFIYDQQGHSLGTLGLNGNETAVTWQSAPGNNSIINQSIEEVFKLENAHLRDMAISLFRNGPVFFRKFWKAIDKMHNFIEPQNYVQAADLAVLIGRPVALTEALLRLEVDDAPAINQSWTTITSGAYPTDNKFTAIDFPVILGNLKQVNDGLIGYYTQQDGKYNFDTFFTEGATETGETGIVKPLPDTIKLTVSPKTGSQSPYDPQADAKYVLLLIDPRTSIHACMGMLPTKVIDIPPDQYADTLGILEMTFLAAPVLKGAGALNLPVPEEEGYHWSWIEEVAHLPHPIWTTSPPVSYVTNEAVSAYTPQTIAEGWLRLNPQLLRFALLNNSRQPAAISNSINALQIIITNRKPSVISFIPGLLKEKGLPNTGSVIYIHMGVLVKQIDVSKIQLAATGWSFKAMNDPRYGNYWAATPVNEVSLRSGHSITITANNVITADLTGQVQIYFDYSAIEGLNDGQDEVMITLIHAG